MVSGSTMQLTFKRLQLANLGMVTNNIYNLLERLLKYYLFPFSTMYLYEAGFSLYTLPKIAYCNKLKEISRKLQLFFVKPDLRQICKKDKIVSPYSLIFFVLCYCGWNRYFFHKNGLSMLM